jgi:hypothetical protein
MTIQSNIFDASGWSFSGICRRNEVEWLRYQNGELSVSVDGGTTWVLLDWKMGLVSRLNCVIHRAEWPPGLDCFGWRRGRVTVAWHGHGEEQFNIGKYLATFDNRKQRWSLEFVGVFKEPDEQLYRWFESEGFEVFYPVRQLDS